MMDGRVKTLHPRLYAGLLARARRRGAPAAAARARDRAGRPRVREPLPVRADRRARRRRRRGDRREHRHRRPDDDPRGRQEQRVRGRASSTRPTTSRVLAELRESDGRLSLRHAPAAGGEGVRLHRALRRGDRRAGSRARTYEGFPPTLERRLREGHRPALRREPAPARRPSTRARARRRTCSTACAQLHGKELSFNNLLDLSSARELVEDFDGPACAIVKHNNPCGCAVGRDAQLAYERAFACDPQSAYGGVIALNRPVDRACAEQLVEAVHRGAARARLRRRTRSSCSARRRTCACSSSRDWPAPAREVEAKPVIGGQLVQTRDVVTETREQMRVMSARAAERARVAGHAVRLEGLPPRALQRDRDRRASGARRSASAPGR